MRFRSVGRMPLGKKGVGRMPLGKRGSERCFPRGGSEGCGVGTMQLGKKGVGTMQLGKRVGTMQFATRPFADAESKASHRCLKAQV